MFSRSTGMEHWAEMGYKGKKNEKKKIEQL